MKSWNMFRNITSNPGMIEKQNVNSFALGFTPRQEGYILVNTIVLIWAAPNLKNLEAHDGPQFFVNFGCAQIQKF